MDIMKQHDPGDESLSMEDFLNKKYGQWAQAKSRVIDASAAEWAKQMGVASPTLSQWMNGHRDPTGANVHALADYFGPIIYKILKQPPRMPEDPAVYALVQAYYNADEQSRQQAVKILEESQAGRRKPYSGTASSMA